MSLFTSWSFWVAAILTLYHSCYPPVYHIVCPNDYGMVYHSHRLSISSEAIANTSASTASKHRSNQPSQSTITVSHCNHPSNHLGNHRPITVAGTLVAAVAATRKSMELADNGRKVLKGVTRGRSAPPRTLPKVRLRKTPPQVTPTAAKTQWYRPKQPLQQIHGKSAQQTPRRHLSQSPQQPLQQPL
jgi:hypothetical protein